MKVGRVGRNDEFVPVNVVNVPEINNSEARGLMKPRMKTGVVPIKTFLVVGEKIMAEKSGFQTAIPTTWLLFALFHVITIFAIHRARAA